MSYLDRIEFSLRRSEDGRLIFYSHGVLGSGYVVTDEAKERQLRGFLKRHHIFGFALVVVFATIPDAYALEIAAAVVAIVLYELRLPSLTRELTRTKPLTLRESLREGARVYDLPTLWFLEIAAVLFVLGSIFVILVDPRRWLVCLASIGFFGVCALAFAAVLKVKVDSRRGSATAAPRLR